MPMLAYTCSQRSCQGRRQLSMASRMFSATCSASVRLQAVSSTANSSPPRRATVSVLRTWACSRRATSTSMRSPVAWPAVSLTALKWSRSMKRAQQGRPSAAARRSLRRRSNSRRFTSSVSASCVDTQDSASRWLRARLTSSTVHTLPAPTSCQSTGAPNRRPQNWLPSRRTMRTSSSKARPAWKQAPMRCTREAASATEGSSTEVDWPCKVRGP